MMCSGMGWIERESHDSDCTAGSKAEDIAGTTHFRETNYIKTKKKIKISNIFKKEEG